MRCVIFGAAPIGDDSFYSSILRADDFVICADGGFRHAERLGRKPDVILGDFDSLRQGKPCADALVYPTEKDDTDMGLALKYALSHGMKEICMLGGLNGRLDHTVANLHLMQYALNRGANAYLMDENMFVTLFQKEYTLEKSRYRYVSLFPFGGSLTGVTYEGLKYPLYNAQFKTEDSYGVSNEMAAENAKITLQSGTALLIMTNDILR